MKSDPRASMRIATSSQQQKILFLIMVTAMPDDMTPEQRRKNMQHIRSKDTSIEIKLRKALWHEGIRYRKNYKALPGKPDIAITKYRIAIFCDSEFFHGKDWDSLQEKLKKGKNPDYWIAKISRNIERDQLKDRELRALGWLPLHFWGKEITKDLDGCIKVIEESIFERTVEGSE